MWKIYWKQTIQLIKQNTLISTISIIGTALAIMMIMVLLLVDRINIVEIAPEVNRDKILYIKRYETRDTINNSSVSSNISRDLFDKYIKNLKTPSVISLVDLNDYNLVTSLISRESHNKVLNGRQMFTDANYWKIMSFDFVAGAPFTQADCDAHINKVVVVESKAKELFGNSKDAINQMIKINYEPFQITGVVKDVSPIFSFCNASLFCNSIHAPDGCTVLLLANDTKEFDQIKEEIRNAEKRYCIDHPNEILILFGPYDQKYQKYNVSNSFVEENKVDMKNYFILLILLVIPAVNLSSFSFSQIQKRIEEIGIRKSFGASKWNIVKQMLMENFITTLIGGIIGLVFSYGILFWLRNWLLEIPDGGAIPPQVLLSPLVFVMVFIICFALNILSAGLPAIITLKMSIVDALNRK